MTDTSRRNAPNVGDRRSGTPRRRGSSVSHLSADTVRVTTAGLVLDRNDLIIVKLLPEMCEVAVRMKVCDQFVAWSLLRTIDRILNRGAGKIGKRCAIAILMQTMDFPSKRTVQRMISDGMGLFWRDGKNGTLYLCGIKHICRIMDIDYIRSKWYNIPMNTLFGSPSEVKSLVVCCVAARDGVPVSIANLVERLGISERTLHYYIAANTGPGKNFFKRQNLMVISMEDGAREAARKARELIEEGVPVEIMEWKDGRFAVCRRLPNTILSRFQRTDSERIRYRLRALSGLGEIEAHERLYSRGKRKGTYINFDSARNIHGPVYVRKQGRPVEMWAPLGSRPIGSPFVERLSPSTEEQAASVVRRS